MLVSGEHSEGIIVYVTCLHLSELRQMWDCRKRDAAGLMNLHSWLRVDVDVTK